MNTNPIHEKLKERFRQFVKGNYEFDDQESEDKMFDILYQVYQLAEVEKQADIANKDKHIKYAMAKIMRQDTTLSIYQELECALNPPLPTPPVK